MHTHYRIKNKLEKRMSSPGDVQQYFTPLPFRTLSRPIPDIAITLSPTISPCPRSNPPSQAPERKKENQNPTHHPIKPSNNARRPPKQSRHRHGLFVRNRARNLPSLRARRRPRRLRRPTTQLALRVQQRRRRNSRRDPRPHHRSRRRGDFRQSGCARG